MLKINTPTHTGSVDSNTAQTSSDPHPQAPVRRESAASGALAGLPRQVGTLDPQRVAGFSKEFNTVLDARRKATDHAALHPQGKDQPVRLGNVIGNELATRRKPIPLKPDATNSKWKMGSGQDGKGPAEPASGSYNYVVHDSGDVSVGKMGHYHLNGGATHKEPIYAGEVVFKDGEVQAWNNNSGHFKPPPGLAHQAPFPMDRFGSQHTRKPGSASTIQSQAQAHQAVQSGESLKAKQADDVSASYRDQKAAAQLKVADADAHRKDAEGQVKAALADVYAKRNTPEYKDKAVKTVLNELAAEHGVGKNKVQKLMKPMVNNNFTAWKD
jgi:hypothetical protein